MSLLDPGFARRRRTVGVAFGVFAVALASTPAGAEPASGAGPVAPQPPEPAAEKITLGDAVSRALSRNPSVAVALAEIDRADALVTEARSGWYPTLSGYASYTRLDHDRVFNGVKELSANEVSANLTLTVPLVSAPAWINTRLARDNRRITEASAADVRRQVAQATARAYLTVVTQHRLIAAAETARANAKDHFDYAHTR
ncbi:MAG TPA: TolC family protein, partial [Polyangia bacterium]|nr:TolC family protein [Polyangia bacterium]